MTLIYPVPKLHFSKCLRIVLFAFTILTAVLATAADEVVHFDNPAHKQMYQAILKEYRCLKCQNQNLWDSNAALAGDLRREIREQIVSDKSKAEIDEYLVARYGEFVLYRPRFSAKTAILWIGPFALLLVGMCTLVLTVRSRGRHKSDAANGIANIDESEVYSPDKLAKARELLKD
jgi:cytochrome c-type biogenesis protein CcmH